MVNQRALAAAQQDSRRDQSFPDFAPQESLPKGGGAIRGIGETFATNPDVPIATSPGRSGFGQQLGLSYDFGAGNGLLGIGWSRCQPSITRKTDKRLPQYRDAAELDVFILSGAEDLVRVFKKNPNGSWAQDSQGHLNHDEESRASYLVKRYRTRIEGLFTRIELNRADYPQSDAPKDSSFARRPASLEQPCRK